MIQGKKKYTISELKSQPPQFFLNLINDAKGILKKDKVMRGVFKDHDVDISFLDLIPIKFDKLKVSATTSRGVISLNYKLLLDGVFHEDYGYLIHEVTHYLQQCFGDRPTKGAENGSYLDNEDEQEGFQYQVKYISEEFGEDEADEYVDNLLDHHDIDKKQEREDKKDTLMSKI